MLFNVANLTGFVHATPARKLLKNCALTPEFHNLAVGDMQGSISFTFVHWSLWLLSMMLQNMTMIS